MAKYTVRIELHKTGSKEPTWSDYDSLHKHMEDKGFSRRIKDGSVLKELPRAEYIKTSEETLAQILAIAKRAVELSPFNGGVLATGPTGWLIDGLKSV